jgi:hypothetical protein
MKTLLLIAIATLYGCAANPYAWKDLGDGQGMRGWAGIPLQYSVPVALAAGSQGYSNCRTPNPVYVYPAYNPAYSPVFNPVPIGQ